MHSLTTWAMGLTRSDRTSRLYLTLTLHPAGITETLPAHGVTRGVRRPPSFPMAHTMAMSCALHQLT